MLIDGQWSTQWYKPDEKGNFVRSETQIRHQITADGSSGFKAEAGRYHLYVSMACPWAHRTLIMRRLKGLTDAISLSVVDPLMTEDGWHFSDEPGCIPDPVFGASFMREIYVQAQSDYTGRVTVPVLWDKREGVMVNHESLDIMRMFDTAFEAVATEDVQFYPEALRDKIDATIEAIYEPINNGVYRAGFATTQGAYEEAVEGLFEALEHWNGILARRPYLCGYDVTEADWCLFTTLVRFEQVYHYHFKCNRKRLRDLRHLWEYTKELYQIPGVAETCNLTHIKEHYYRSHPNVNPHGIVPVGPKVDFAAPWTRDAHRLA